MLTKSASAPRKKIGDSNEVFVKIGRALVQLSFQRQGQTEVFTVLLTLLVGTEVPEAYRSNLRLAVTLAFDKLGKNVSGIPPETVALKNDVLRQL